MLARITHDPAGMGGRASLRGMQSTVALGVNLAANGLSRDDVLRESPSLAGAANHDALRYAAALADEELHPLSATPT